MEKKNITNGLKDKWKFGKIRQILNGDGTCILTHGAISSMAFNVIKKSKKQISLYSCSTLKPFDESTIKKFIKNILK